MRALLHKDTHTHTHIMLACLHVQSTYLLTHTGRLYRHKRGWQRRCGVHFVQLQWNVHKCKVVMAYRGSGFYSARLHHSVLSSSIGPLSSPAAVSCSTADCHHPMVLLLHKCCLLGYGHRESRDTLQSGQKKLALIQSMAHLLLDQPI